MKGGRIFDYLGAMNHNTGKRLVCPATLILLLFVTGPSLRGEVTLEKDRIRIVFSDREEGPLKLALHSLEKDIFDVLGTVPPVAGSMNRDLSETEIVIVNLASGQMPLPEGHLRELDGFESHRVYVQPETSRIYLLGNDLRGTIYAIYTFAEEVLGVPPLKYWCSWKPVKRNEISIPDDLDLFYPAPQVRYRSILTGDQDYFTPWRSLSDEHDNIWLETVLRLKLNTVETYSTILPGYQLTDYAYLIAKYGLVITSHHTSGLNTSFRTWNDYWREVRGMEPPEYLLSNREAILDFFRYNAETVRRSGVENLWTVAFRGERDQPFWSIFKDAPEGDQERAEVINDMLQIQYDLIREVTGEEEPYARITFYDELANLMARGYLKPPDSRNMIWTYVAGRRDHYPYDDIVNFKGGNEVKLGYYMNFGFASTGAHVAPAEGPWKMEFNYRYVNNKAPLYFSVVNVGNFREFVLELSANARLLWNLDGYDTDQFMIEYCTRYFGERYAAEIAALYKEFYQAYWNPKASEFEGLERQFVFQDLRYARAFDHIYRGFYASGDEVNMNPLREIGYESVPGRTFRIDPVFNHAGNQVDALLNGMQQTIPKFEAVAIRCSGMMIRLDEDRQTFFNDNLRIYSYYMAHLSKALYHYVFAYKHQSEREILLQHLNQVYREASLAQGYLLEAQHGPFSTWYADAEPMARTFQIDSLKSNILSLIAQAESSDPIGDQKSTVVYINSYHRGFPPSDQITAAVMEGLPADRVEVYPFFMDTKRHPSEAYIRERAEALYDSVRLIDPDVLIVSDDNAMKYLVVPYFQDDPLPIVFCGVNWSVDQYDISAYNITGVLEILPVAELVRTLRPYYPDMKKLLVLNENTTTSRKTRPLLDTLLGNLGLEVTQALVDDFEEWKSVFASANETFDLIYLQTRGAIEGWDHDAALRHIDQYMKIPLVTCEEFMMPYAVFGVTQFSEEQGMIAAEMANSILKGTLPNGIPVSKNSRTRIWFNPRLAEKIGFQPDKSLLERAKMIKP